MYHLSFSTQIDSLTHWTWTTNGGHLNPGRFGLSRFGQFWGWVVSALVGAGIFSAILGRGPRAFLIGKISDIHPEFGKFSNHSKLMIFSNLT